MKQDESQPAKYQDIISRLEQKYKAGGQDLEAYLEGLFYTDYLNYWDYIQTDALLGLQNLRTSQPDELIFIVYHQSSELYFKLILSEIQQICHTNPLETDWLIEKLARICRYWQLLIDSFEVMEKGMEPEQFRKFRMALMPASGFQSFQYRQIEIASTDLWLLASPETRSLVDAKTSLSDAFEHIYWKQGAIEVESHAKTLTLVRFEEKYNDRLIGWAAAHQTINIRQRILALGLPDIDSDLYNLLRRYDHLLNVAWPLAHLRSAAHYLRASQSQHSHLEQAIPATGGTNWQKYLPAIRQKRMFFPELWSEQEKSDWGRA